MFIDAICTDKEEKIRTSYLQNRLPFSSVCLHIWSCDSCFHKLRSFNSPANSSRHKTNSLTDKNIQYESYLTCRHTWTTYTWILMLKSSSVQYSSNSGGDIHKHDQTSMSILRTSILNTINTCLSQSWKE